MSCLALVFGLVASSALVVGAVAGAYWTPPRLLLASALAFAIGALQGGRHVDRLRYGRGVSALVPDRGGVEYTTPFGLRML